MQVMVNWCGKNIHVELKFLHSSRSSSISGSSVSSSLAFFITCLLHLKTFFFLRHSTSLAFSIFRPSFSSDLVFFSKSSYSSFFYPDLLFLLFFSFSPYPSSKLLLWNPSLSNSSSMWLNSSMPTIEFVFESLDFCHQTWDASLQHSFKIMLTDENVSRNHVKSQISPYYTPKN